MDNSDDNHDNRKSPEDRLLNSGNKPFRLNTRRAKALTRKLLQPHGIIGKSVKHNQYGRNRLFVVNGSLFVKQIISQERSAAEHDAILNFTGSQFFLSPSFVSHSLGIFVYPYIKGSINLDELARHDSLSALSRLVSLSETYFIAAQNVKCSAPTILKKFIDGPIPAANSFFDMSPALRHMYAKVQASSIINIASFSSYTGPFHPSHGDLKLDNFLVEGTNTLVVDWEMYSLAPCGWDLACIIGSTFFACARHASTGKSQANFFDALAAVHAIIKNFNSANNVKWALSDVHLIWLIVHYFLERLCSEAVLKQLLNPMDEVLFELMQAIYLGKV
ncbi:phosphotransferase family protein [Ancylobacter radicis]|uniref:Phosphotransferase n=1 Tax=Ancylobacter radicis TaxID=2836179 RepID=A0ABS5R7S7_9HYPH|nr:phosphotransferase [Ancylobacter radicis]MBS9477716.1 phosphotransferase [Ancylobacter radicis]